MGSLPPMSGTFDALERVFAHSAFRPGQQEVVQSILAHRPTLAVMPTGAGKSLCYQLPAVMLDGLTLVVSPLIALIRDQVRALTSIGVAAASLTSLDGHEDRQATLRRLEAGELDLLYVAPERFRNSAFLRSLQKARVALFVVDEAHCISQWGHDFRPDYARLGAIIDSLKPERVAAFTATATHEVRDNIVEQLGLRDPNTIVTGFDRANLELSVEETARGKAKLQATLRALEKWTQGSGAAIVYVATRKKSELVAAALNEAGYDVHAYHAGLDPQTRRRVEEHFSSAAQPVVVATTAFGMGIDRSDVRVVVHFQIPSSVEGYYQEVGRAGRDGAPAGGVLIYDSSDLRYAFMKHEASCPTPQAVLRAFEMVGPEPYGFDEWVQRIEPEVGPASRAALVALQQAGDLSFTGAGPRHHVDRPTVDPEMLQDRARRERARLDAMIGYVTRAACRRRYLVDYFEDATHAPACEVCDRCRAPAAVALQGEPKRHALMALSCIARMRGSYGKARIIDVLIGSRARPVTDAGLDQLSTHGLLKGWSKPEVMALLDALTRADLAKVTGHDYPKLMLTEAGAQALKGGETISVDLQLPRWEPQAEAIPNPKSDRGAAGLDPEARPLFEALRAWRTDTARALGKPPYVVAHDKLLAQLSAERPRTTDELAGLAGIGPAKLERYGAAILEIVAAHPT